MFQVNKLTAFTLAEVLITLTVIGVVASLTIPTLMNNINDEHYKTAYKKAFADANQAFNMAKNNDELASRPSKWDIPSTTINFNAFRSYFSITKNCNNNDNGNCWDATGEKALINLPTSNAMAFIDSSGRAWSVYSSSEVIILVDINAFKPPNRYGRDRFLMVMSNGDTSLTPVHNRQTGQLIKIEPWYDCVGVDTNFCPSGGCYGTSWLSN